MESKKLVCVIPARGGSKGIKNKNLQEILGKSLISICIDTYKNSKYIDEVFVSSDSDEILKEARKNGAISIKREKNLSSDTASSESVLEDFLRNSYKGDLKTAVFAQCTTPFITTDDVDEAVELFFSNKFDSLFSGSKHKGFLWKKTSKNSYTGINHSENSQRKRRQDLDDEVLENGGFYLFDIKGFLNSKNRFFGKIGCFITRNIPIEIDDYDELDYARFFSKKLKTRNIGFKNLFLDFDGVLTDNKVTTYLDGKEKVLCSKEDSLALSEIKKNKKETFILTSEKNNIVDIRAKKLGIEVFRCNGDKKKAFYQIHKQKNLKIADSVFVGNDINDYELFASDIFCCCPKDAAPQVREISDFVSSRNGGDGAVRQICEKFFNLI